MEWLVNLLNAIGIPKRSGLRGIESPINVGKLEGLAVCMNGTDLPEEIYKSCDINYAIEQLEQTIEGIGACTVIGNWVSLPHYIFMAYCFWQ